MKATRNEAAGKRRSVGLRRAETGAGKEVGNGVAKGQSTPSQLLWVAPVSVVAGVLLVLLGSVVRVTGSGLGCPDWPLCHGGLLPPLDLPSIVEFSHRLGAAVLTVLVVAVSLLAWRSFRRDRWVWIPALLAPAILILQILLGAVTVKSELPPAIVGSHLGVALLLVADLTAVTLGVHPDWGKPRSQKLEKGWPSPLAGAALVSLFVLLFLGATVVETGSSLACPDWPLCSGGLVPLYASDQVVIQFLHRLAALVTVLLVILVFRETAGLYQEWPQPLLLAGTALALLVVQVVVGAGMVLLRLPLELQALHVLLATSVWTLLSALVVMQWRWKRQVLVQQGAEA